MPSSVREVFAAAGLEPEGGVGWGTRVAVTAPGVYAIVLGRAADSTAAALTSAPISDAALARWLERRPELTLDARRPMPPELAERLQGFWLPDEVILYIGKATALGSRLDQYYKTPLGARTPHAGGYFLKTLANLDELAVFYASTPEPASAEYRMLETFCANVSAATQLQLHDPEHPFPFANLEWPPGVRKRHGLKGARERRRVRTAVPPSGDAGATTAGTRRPRQESASGMHSTQPITEADRRAGRIRIPRAAKHLFPNERSEIEIELRGRRQRCRYDPRLGPDRERSGVLLVGRQMLAKAVETNESLAVEAAEGVLRLT